MPYIELINRVMERELGPKGLEIVSKQVEALGVDERDINMENLPSFAKNISEAVVTFSSREEAKSVYWELLKLLDIEKIVDGTEDPLLKAAQLADMGDAAAYAAEWKKALSYYTQIGDTGAPGCGPLAEIKQGELHSRMNEQKDAREHYLKARNKAMDDGNFLMEAMALRGIGYTSWRMGEFPEAIENFNTAIDVARQVEDMNMVGKINTDIGLVHVNTGLYNEALRRFKESIEILLESGDYDELARAYNNSGEVYKELKEYKKALDVYQKCIEASDKVKNEVFKAFGLMNSAECYARNGWLTEAKQALEQARPLVESQGDKYLLSASYLIKGFIATHEKNWDEMEKNFEKDIELLREMDYPYEVASNTLEYARALKKKGDIEKARDQLQAAKDILSGLTSTKMLKEIDKELATLG